MTSKFSTLNNNTSSSSNSKNYIIKVGSGNNSVSFNQYYPPYIEIAAGDSITWYNGMDVPNPHTVTFLLGLNNIEKIAVPFYLPNSSQLVPVIGNLGEPLEETTSNGTKIIMLLNARALYPTIIDKQEQVTHLDQDPVYVLRGNEEFINSGPLLSIDKKQTSDYYFNNFFTIVFTKPGLYEYSCLFHPWMIGKVLVKSR